MTKELRSLSEEQTIFRIKFFTEKIQMFDYKAHSERKPLAWVDFRMVVQLMPSPHTPTDIQIIVIQ